MELIEDEAYFKIDGRPVVFMLCIYTNPLTTEALDKAKLGEAVDAFKARIRQSCGKDAIIIIQDSNPETRTGFAAKYFGAQAVSAYWALEWKPKGKYADIVSWGKRYWERLKATGSEVVPIVTTGADPRPRYINPVPWDKNQKPNPDNQNYYEHATPEEICGFLKDAINFVKANPEKCPFGIINIYAWNEYDEGGWLAPTFGDGLTRLNAVESAIKSAQ